LKDLISLVYQADRQLLTSFGLHGQLEKSQTGFHLIYYI